MVTFTYITRARCDCGFLWTTPGSANIICACGESSIISDAPAGGPGLPFSEDDFKQACADEVGVSVDDVSVVAA